MSSKREEISSKSDLSKTVATAGEALQNCTESEWNASDEPYSAELLNVKKKPNRVSVFTATEKVLDTVVVTEDSAPITHIIKPPVEHHNMARLIHKTCQLLLEKTTADGTEVNIKLEFPDWRDDA